MLRRFGILLAPNSRTMFQSRSGFSLRRDASIRSTISGGIEFQSRSGFSECFDTTILSRSWLLTSFQSRSGFSECFDKFVPFFVQPPDVEFQSRSGFSECFDPATIRCQPRTSSFNPVLGFLSASTRRRRSSRPTPRPVSIPFWVF